MVNSTQKPITLPTNLQQQKFIWSIRQSLSVKTRSYLQQQKFIWSIRPNATQNGALCIYNSRNLYGQFDKGNEKTEDQIYNSRNLYGQFDYRKNGRILLYLQQQKFIWSIRQDDVRISQRSTTVEIYMVNSTFLRVHGAYSIYNSRNLYGQFDLEQEQSAE